MQFLIYNEKDGKINVRLSENKKDATKFSFEDFGWNEYLNQSLHARVNTIGKTSATPFGSALSFL
jgi:hypothetical protein